MTIPNTAFFPASKAPACQRTTWNGSAMEAETTGEVFHAMEWLIRGMFAWGFLQNPHRSTAEPTLTTAEKTEFHYWLKPPAWNATTSSYSTEPDLKVWNPENEAWGDITPEVFASSMMSIASGSGGSTSITPI